MEQTLNKKNGFESPKGEMHKKINIGETNDRVNKRTILEKSNRQNNWEDLAEFIKDYSWEEKFEWMHQKKLKGNRLFNKKNYDAAVQTYQEVFVGLDQNCSQEKKQRQINEIQIPCMLNIASCLKQKRDYFKALEHCTKAIELNKENSAAYIRRAMIYQAMSEHQKALADYKTAKELGSEESTLTTISKAMEELHSTQLKRKKSFREYVEEGSLYREATIDESSDKITVQESKSNVEEEGGGSNVLHYNDDLEELNHLGVLKYLAYPIKKGFKFLKEKTMWCKRRRTNYVVYDNNQNDF